MVISSIKIVEINEKSEPETVIPHFRRGYFKRLNSDFYKNKKGQIFFVHETDVNAKARHWNRENCIVGYF